MKTRQLLPTLILALCLLGFSAPLFAEIVVEAWRSPFGDPRSVSVNPTDGSVWVAAGASIMHLGPSGAILSQANGFWRPQSVSVDPVDGSCWVADTQNDQVVHLSASGAELWRGGGFSRPRSVSVNSSDGSCWVADTRFPTGNGQVVHLSASGAELWRGGAFYYPLSVSVNPSDGSCWVAEPIWGVVHGQVVHLSAAGVELWRGGRFDYPCSVSVNPTDGSCWVADIIYDEVVHLSTGGAELWRGGGFNWSGEESASVSVDSSDGSCWVADTINGQVVHLSASGAVLSRSAGFYPDAVSVNPSDGSCWVAESGNNQVVHLGANGAELWRGGGFVAPGCVSVNPTDGSCWVADWGSKQVVHLSASGAELWRGGAFYWPQSVSVNPTDGSCCVTDLGQWDGSKYVNGAVVRLSAAGTGLWRVGGFSCPYSASVNPTDGSCWVADNANFSGQVVHLSASGEELWRGGGLSHPVSVSVNATDASCWVADGGNDQVVHLSASGAELWRGGGFNAGSVSVNPSDGSCWVADTGNNAVVHLSASGAELWRGGGFHYPLSVSVNPSDGSCWVANYANAQVVHLSASGAELWGGGRFSYLQSVSANPSDGSCWVTDAWDAQVVHLVPVPVPFDIVSPYPTVLGWSSGGWHKHRGQLHAHYHAEDKISDSITPLELLNRYHDRGYDFLAVTEHHQKTPNWSDVFSYQEPSDPYAIASLKGALEDTGTGHILAVNLDRNILTENEWPAFYAKLGSGDTLDARRQRLENITAHGGLAFIAHPDSAFYGWGRDQLYELGGKSQGGTKYNGIELYNAGAASAAYAIVYAAVWGTTHNDTAATIAASMARDDQGFADDTWDELLRRGVRRIWGTAGDDYHPDMAYQWFLLDATSTLAWTTAVQTSAAPTREALENGRFYACKGGSRAPDVTAYWAEPVVEGGVVKVKVGVQLPERHTVRFVTGKWRLWGSSRMAERQPDGTYLATFVGEKDERYIRAEVRDVAGNVTWLQPIWLDEVQTKTEQLPAALGRPRGAPLEQVAVEMEGATLLVSLPQSSVTEVTGSLLGGDARPPGPGIGYFSRCYGFSPDLALDGANSLSISYFPDAVRGFPPEALALYRYDSATGVWQRLGGTVDPTAATVTAAITELGTYTVSAETPDDAGAPTVDITSPLPGSVIDAPTAVTVVASDDQGVASVRFYADGWPVETDNWGGDGWCATLDPANYAPGEKTITAVAEDGVGHQATAQVTVQVAGLMLAPALAISAPAEAEVVWGDLDMRGHWTAQLPMAFGVLRLDDDVVAATSAAEANWNLAMPITVEHSGARRLTFVGFDMYGNRAQAGVNVLLRAFGDIPLGFWARDYIYAAARAGIVQGYPDGTYRPDQAVNRAQMAVYISRAVAGGDASVPTGPATATFPDVPTDHWAYKYIEYCHDENVVEGYWDGYRPEEIVNRAQMAVYVARALVAPTGDSAIPDPAPPATFPDVPTDYWAWKWIEYCHANGVVQGYWDGYHPEEVVNRAQMAVYVQRAFDLPL